MSMNSMSKYELYNYINPLQVNLWVYWKSDQNLKFIWDYEKKSIARGMCIEELVWIFIGLYFVKLMTVMLYDSEFLLKICLP